MSRYHKLFACLFVLSVNTFRMKRHRSHNSLNHLRDKVEAYRRDIRNHSQQRDTERHSINSHDNMDDSQQLDAEKSDSVNPAYYLKPIGDAIYSFFWDEEGNFRYSLPSPLQRQQQQRAGPTHFEIGDIVDYKSQSTGHTFQLQIYNIFPDPNDGRIARYLLVVPGKNPNVEPASIIQPGAIADRMTLVQRLGPASLNRQGPQRQGSSMPSSDVPQSRSSSMPSSNMPQSRISSMPSSNMPQSRVSSMPNSSMPRHQTPQFAEVNGNAANGQGRAGVGTDFTEREIEDRKALLKKDFPLGCRVETHSLSQAHRNGLEGTVEDYVIKVGEDRLNDRIQVKFAWENSILALKPVNLKRKEAKPPEPSQKEEAGATNYVDLYKAFKQKGKGPPSTKDEVCEFYGLPSGCSRKEVLSAYRHCMKQIHPDAPTRMQYVKDLSEPEITEVYEWADKAKGIGGH